MESSSSKSGLNGHILTSITTVTEIDGGPRKATLHHHFTHGSFSGIVEMRSVLWLMKTAPCRETI